MAHDVPNFTAIWKFIAVIFQLKQKRKTETKKGKNNENVYDFLSLFGFFASMLKNLWRWLIKCVKFLVGGRAGKKQPTKVRAKQPKSSKKVKFISEY